MNLYAHQKSFLSRNPNKSALIHSCGLGKTRTAIEWSKLSAGKTLCIVPKSLKTNWSRELVMWSATADILTKEEFRKVHKQLPRYEQVMVDEVHFFLGRSQMHKSLLWYLDRHKIHRFLGLTATCYSSSPWAIYNLATILGHHISWQKFNLTFFNQVRMGNRIIPVVKKNIEGKLSGVVKRICDVVNIEDVLDVPEQLHADPEYFTLTPEQERAIKENYDPVPISRFTKIHEIEQGVLKGNEFRELQVFSCDKNERIMALCEENPKIVIVCRYNAQIDTLKLLLEPHYSVYTIQGATKDRDSVCRAAEAAKRAVVLLQSDCGVGMQLPSFGVCVFASMSFSYISFVQTCGRFLRMNAPSRTTFLYLLTDGESVDQAIYDAIGRKEDFYIELYGNK